MVEMKTGIYQITVYNKETLAKAVVSYFREDNKLCCGTIYGDTINDSNREWIKLFRNEIIEFADKELRSLGITVMG